ncbi:MAG: hypothetical protein A2W98_05760 [Bacteroidetes bacterium GWF2_33_38]|nr:MAG: hypothetical protein A2W98_05760 [Bacteroidetes bacterium GWF2_33_38]OFY71681.1 MAG: hypothetical protein A2265_01165 [Bacteroidetes bacterium RIFOXYA12_FULL_33_9]OFY88517.1 MAG: hypothetical protein A2236_10270 [Bacteroidetes bacterium RIFOXYA2_FULL_33_7]HBX51667.1 hypothetical protein [Bacteroidales bacterium]
MKKIVLILIAVVGFNFGNQLSAQESTSIKFVTLVHDFGDFKEIDGKVSYDFEFTNNGKTPLIVTNVNPSCGCTTPDWTKEPIAPGKKGYVKATYDPKSRPGKFSKTITVTTNVDKPVVLTIKGNVEPKPIDPELLKE